MGDILRSFDVEDIEILVLLYCFLEGILEEAGLQFLDDRWSVMLGDHCFGSFAGAEAWDARLTSKSFHDLIALFVYSISGHLGTEVGKAVRLVFDANIH